MSYGMHAELDNLTREDKEALQIPRRPIAQPSRQQAPIAQAPIAQAPIKQAPSAQAPSAQAPGATNLNWGDMPTPRRHKPPIAQPSTAQSPAKDHIKAGKDKKKSNKKSMLFNVFGSVDSLFTTIDTFIKNTPKFNKFTPKKMLIRFIAAFMAGIARVLSFGGGVLGNITRYFSNNGSKISGMPGKGMPGKGMSGKGMTRGLKWNKALFKLSLLPNVLTIILGICLLILIVWVSIQSFVRWITFGYIKLPNIPIFYNKKITQIGYSIFFVIISFYLMLYLIIDYSLRITPHLDIIQIGKQFIASLYLLWALAGIIVGGAIAKAFYKVSCVGAKPNTLKFAKVIDSSVIYFLGILVGIKLLLLIRPLVYILSKFSIVKGILGFLSKNVSRIIKVLIIYILLRSLIIFIENIISNSIVFLLSKLTKTIKSPPINCNTEKVKKKKQSEIMRLLEKLFKYISMYLTLAFINSIIFIQCPHPFTGLVTNLNDAIGQAIQVTLALVTKIIGEKDFTDTICKKSNLGLGNNLGLGLGLGKKVGFGFGKNFGFGKKSIPKGTTNNTNTDEDREAKERSNSREWRGHEAEAQVFSPSMYQIQPVAPEAIQPATAAPTAPQQPAPAAAPARPAARPAPAAAAAPAPGATTAQQQPTTAQQPALAAALAPAAAPAAATRPTTARPAPAQQPALATALAPAAAATRPTTARPATPGATPAARRNPTSQEEDARFNAFVRFYEDTR